MQGKAVRKIACKYENHQFRRIMPPGAISASVLMPIIDTDDGLSLLFEVRSGNIIQGGEVCFPGGRIEDGESSEATAVREASEELAVDSGCIHVIAPMFRMMGPGGADIYAYLGFIDDYAQTYSIDEVGGVFSLPLKELLLTEPLISDSMLIQEPQGDFHYELIPGGRNYKWSHIRKKCYFYSTPCGVIWGMTAELLYNLLELLRKDGVEGIV